MPSLTTPPAGPHLRKPAFTTNLQHPPVIVTPSTPQRGRSDSRYPSNLCIGEPGRVPLHRRGTSKTYERLEDLLREAGYKETRVFTPEAERFVDRDQEQGENSRQSRRTGSAIGIRGVDAVVDFFTGLLPGAAGFHDDPSSDANSVIEDGEYPGEASPLANKRRPAPKHPSAFAAPARASPPSHPLRFTASKGLRTHVHASAVRGQLRHIASAPNMPKVPPSVAAPPLPTTWLGAVSKAVLGSPATGSHIDGPENPRPHSRQSRRTVRSNLAPKTSTLSDRTNQHRAKGDPSAGTPYSMAAYLNPPQAAPSAVTTVRVVCRSAPASRSSSRVGERPSAPTIGSATGNHVVRKKSTACKPDGVPLLASTRLENETEWHIQGVDGTHIAAATDDADDEDEDNDDEIDFARLLVPPKRQHSIQSLRRHLHRSESTLALQLAKARGDVDEWAPVGPGRSKRMKSQRGRIQDSSDEGESLHPGWGTTSIRRAMMKRRQDIPHNWAPGNRN